MRTERTNWTIAATYYTRWLKKVRHTMKPHLMYIMYALRQIILAVFAILVLPVNLLFALDLPEAEEMIWRACTDGPLFVQDPPEVEALLEQVCEARKTGKDADEFYYTLEYIERDPERLKVDKALVEELKKRLNKLLFSYRYDEERLPRNLPDGVEQKVRGKIGELLEKGCPPSVVHEVLGELMGFLCPSGGVKHKEGQLPKPFDVYPPSFKSLVQYGSFPHIRGAPEWPHSVHDFGQQMGFTPHLCPEFRAGESIDNHFFSDHGLMWC